MKASGRYRKFLLTWNESDLFGSDHDEIKSILSGINKIRYWCMCDEFDKTYKVRHTHLFILFDIPISVVFVSERFPDVNIQYLLPSLNECMDYMRKQGQYCNLNKFEENFSDTFEDSISCSENEIQIKERKNGFMVLNLILYEWYQRFLFVGFIFGISGFMLEGVKSLWEIWKQRMQHISEKKKK